MPQPIDVNTELGRITAAERIAQIADRSSLAAQARNQEEAEVQRQNAESQTQQAGQKSDEVDQKLQRRNPYSGRRRRKTREEAEHTARDAKSLPVIAEEEDQHDLDISI